MRYVAITQRVEIVQHPSGDLERRNALDQAWTAFLAAADLIAVPLPQDPAIARRMMDDLPIDGVILSGGNDLVAWGGDAPERDRMEIALLAYARKNAAPVIGVCRGMQLIQQVFGVPLQRVEGHSSGLQVIDRSGAPAKVVSAHRWGARTTGPDFVAWAQAADGVIKAIRHRREPIVGVMWHPERNRSFDAADIALFRDTFAEVPLR